MPSAAPAAVVNAGHNSGALVDKAIESAARLGDARFRYVKLATS